MNEQSRDRPDPGVLRRSTSTCHRNAWRWYAELVSERRVVCEHDGEHWQISIDGRRLAGDRSFDMALLDAYAITKAREALGRTQTVLP